MSVLVGLDVGTSAVKAVAISHDGEVLGLAEEPYGLSTPRPGWAEQDPEDWWRAAQAALARIPSGPIGLSGQMHGLVVLDRENCVIRPAILWNDGRTEIECAEIEGLFGLERLVALTGNRALAGFTAPKLLWLRRHEPESYARIRRVLLPKDYVHLKLTGEHATDVSDASGTLLFDVDKRRWSAEMCGALEIPAEWLPEALESTELGGAGDQAAAALGVGIDRPGLVSVALGTAGIVFAVLPRYSPDREARVHTFCHAVPGTWHAMGVMLSGGGSFAWLRDVLGAGAATLDEEADRWPPGAEGLLFAPYLSGERTPHSDPHARACLHRALAPSRPRRARAGDDGGRRLRAAGFARAPAWSSGSDDEAGRISGGGSRSDLWTQNRRLRARPAARAHRVRCGIGIRRGAARRRARGVFSLMRPTRLHDASALPSRIEPDPGVGRRLRRQLRAFPSALPGPTTLGAAMNARPLTETSWG
jgi:xylulokinase